MRQKNPEYMAEIAASQEAVFQYNQAAKNSQVQFAKSYLTIFF